MPIKLPHLTRADVAQIVADNPATATAVQVSAADEPDTEVPVRDRNGQPLISIIKGPQRQQALERMREFLKTYDRPAKETPHE